MERPGGGWAGEPSAKDDRQAACPPTRVWERWSDWQELVGSRKQELAASQSVLARSGNPDEAKCINDGRADDVADAIRCPHVK